MFAVAVTLIKLNEPRENYQLGRTIFTANTSLSTRGGRARTRGFSVLPPTANSPINRATLIPLTPSALASRPIYSVKNRRTASLPGIRWRVEAGASLKEAGGQPPPFVNAEAVSRIRGKKRENERDRGRQENRVAIGFPTNADDSRRDGDLKTSPRRRYAPPAKYTAERASSR